MSVTAAKVLRDARRRAGLSQTELALRAGVTQPVISAYEAGKRDPSLSTLSRLVEATGQRLRLEVLADAGLPGGLPDTPMGRQLGRNRQAILEAAERRGVTNLRVFGSVARGEDAPSSDVDLLVDLTGDVGIVSLIGLEREITEALQRRVEIVPAANLKEGLADQVMAEAIPL